MAHLSIIPQKFSFTKPAIYEGYGRLISPGMNVTIEEKDSRILVTSVMS